MIRITLVTGRQAAKREAAIARAMSPARKTALILEGLPSGTSLFFEDHGNLKQVRIAPGCLCCTGNLTLRVTLNRLLRQEPDEVFISLATDTHLEQLRQFLASPPYDKLLQLTDTLST